MTNQEFMRELALLSHEIAHGFVANALGFDCIIKLHPDGGMQTVVEYPDDTTLEQIIEITAAGQLFNEQSTKGLVDTSDDWMFLGNVPQVEIDRIVDKYREVILDYLDDMSSQTYAIMIHTISSGGSIKMSAKLPDGITRH